MSKKVIFLIVFIFLAAVGYIFDEKEKESNVAKINDVFKVDISTDYKKINNKLLITGKTNLPFEMKLVSVLTNKNGFKEKANTYVDDEGNFNIAFNNVDSNIVYVLEIKSSEDQKDSVKKIIGKRGQNMSGFSVFEDNGKKIIDYKTEFYVGYSEKEKMINKVPRLHPWDGVAVAIKNYIKKTANDPGSVEYVDVYKICELSNGMFSQRVTFRAKNGFGALVLNDYVFLIKGNRDYSEVLAAEESDTAVNSLANNNITVIRNYGLDDLR